jgi:membrane-bound inhibitor of C-type lysozyme
MAIISFLDIAVLGRREENIQTKTFISGSGNKYSALLIVAKISNERCF